MIFKNPIKFCSKKHFCKFFSDFFLFKINFFVIPKALIGSYFRGKKCSVLIVYVK